MSELPFFIVDVFAEKKYAGNQLAVFTDGGGLSTGDMQAIAGEMNFSETTFIMSRKPRDGGYDVRIFTPGREVPFAGHPTLGTAHIIGTKIAPDAGDRIVLNLGVGKIPVSVKSDAQGVVYWMSQIEPIFGKILAARELAPVLGLDTADIDPRYPVQEVSTGLPHIIVPLTGLSALQKIRVDRDRYFDLVRGAWAGPIMVFTSESRTPDHDISVRMFADCFGIAEDPATGSGNGCLAGYLVRHRWRGSDVVDLRSGQGHEIGRPSILYLSAREREGHIEVLVGGRAVTIAEGRFV